MAFEHGMRMDFDRSKAIPVMKGNLLIEADYVGGILGNRESYFAKASPHFYFSLNEGFQKSLLHRRGNYWKSVSVIAILVMVPLTFFTNNKIMD